MACLKSFLDLMKKSNLAQIRWAGWLWDPALGHCLDFWFWCHAELKKNFGLNELMKNSVSLSTTGTIRVSEISQLNKLFSCSFFSPSEKKSVHLMYIVFPKSLSMSPWFGLSLYPDSAFLWGFLANGPPFWVWLYSWIKCNGLGWPFTTGSIWNDTVPRFMHNK